MRVKVTVTGCATPTVWPAGWMLATSVGVVMPAALVAAEAATVITARLATASNFRSFSTLAS